MLSDIQRDILVTLQDRHNQAEDRVFPPESAYYMGWETLMDIVCVGEYADDEAGVATTIETLDEMGLLDISRTYFNDGGTDDKVIITAAGLKMCQEEFPHHIHEMAKRQLRK